MQEIIGGLKEFMDKAKKLKSLTPYGMCSHQYDYNLSRITDPRQRRISNDLTGLRSGWGLSEHSSSLKNSRLKPREGDTFEWFINSGEYRQWLSSKISQLLRVSGGSGYGKSVLTFTVVKKVLSNSN